MAQRWLPLESNPTSMNAWSQSLGLDTSLFSWQDMYSLDEDTLSWVSQPVKAIVMLFPITPQYETMRLAQDAEIEENGVAGVGDMIYFKQRVGNACGTFALLHALGNSSVELEAGVLRELFQRCVDKTPLERAELLETSGSISEAHQSAASTGNQTATPNLADDVDLHFVTFVVHDGHLIELDGRRNSPVNHGPIQVGILEDTVKVVKKIIEITKSIQFNLITLSPTPGEE